MSRRRLTILLVSLVLLGVYVGTADLVEKHGGRFEFWVMAPIFALYYVWTISMYCLAVLVIGTSIRLQPGYILLLLALPGFLFEIFLYAMPFSSLYSKVISAWPNVVPFVVFVVAAVMPADWKRPLRSDRQRDALQAVLVTAIVWSDPLTSNVVFGAVRHLQQLEKPSVGAD